MKKILSLTFIAILMGFAAKAQMEIRPAVGINLSNIRTAPDGTTTSAKLGFQIGGSLTFGDRFYVSPGIFYYQQATQYVADNQSSGSNTVSDEKIAGVQIPVLVGLRVVNPKNDPMFNLRIFAGPSILFNTKNSFSGVNNDNINWKSSSWAARIGAGVDVLFLYADVGYDFGLSNTFESTATPNTITDTKHNTLLVNVGIRFKL